MLPDGGQPRSLLATVVSARRARAHREPRAPGGERHRVVLQRRPGNIRQTTGAAQGDRPQDPSCGDPLEPGQSAQPLALSNVKAAARSLGVQLQLLEARDPSEFDGAFAAMAKERIGALLVLADGMLVAHRTRL